jgi:hypothetical protein
MHLFFVLCYLGVSLDDVDLNHSGLPHWTSFKDNGFMLRFFKRVGLDLHVRD